MKNHFFLGKLYQQLFGFTLSSHWWYSIPSLVWFGQLLDPMKKNFFKILKNLQFAKLAKFRTKNHFFPRQAIPTTFGFTLSLHWWYSIPSLVWFGQLLDRMKNNYFKILKNSQFAKIAKFRMKNHFFLGKLYQQLFCFTLSLHWWHSIPSLVWFGQLLDPMKTTIFKILKNSQFAKIAKLRMKNHFFLGKLYQQLFCFTLSLHWWHSIPSLVWFGQLLDPMKTTIFKILKNSQFAKISKFRMKNHFFLGKLYQQLFCFTLSLHWWYSIPTLVSFGQFLDPMKTTIFKILENSQFAKFAKFRMKNHFFLGKLYQQLFCFTLSLHWWHSIPSLVWFGQLLDPMKTTIFKILKNSQFAKISKFRMKNHFFLGKLYQQLFCFTLSLHWWYSIPTLVSFGQFLDPMKTTIFKILENSQFAKFAKFRMKNHFFLGKLYHFFLLYTVITLVTLNTEFGLIWAIPWLDGKQLFLKFSKIRNSRKSQNSVWKTIFS